ncbi:MtrAB system histidine kinase MtrB [Pseudoglutamicibacter albus]|uniref:MtrAB system histidine kinase MtrB n=1 Tax=Pseudoglutamicibacter TaxID=1742991 RepID=UPI00117A18BF|nr:MULTISPECIES: MtrAB system histidine kinase MtrB [Pseudoglutamicibacter]MDK7082342.1 MtrAB system histidine kinase MtrB [Pseudoglutamicibacter cumminsii]WIK84088.1 MtrAB system histidine kinase MtrB [Pseudoglutamicibacter albus]
MPNRYLVRRRRRSTVVPDPSVHSKWDPRRWLGVGLRLWRRSVQFRTVVITVVLVGLAEVIVGGFLSVQISKGLFQERLEQVSAEATRGLEQADSSFSSASTTNANAASTLVMDTLRGMQGDGVAVRRDVVFRLLPGASAYWVPGQDTSAEASSAITDELQNQVAAGSDIYWQSVALPGEKDQVKPGVAFGKRVTVPPGRDYALFLVYDFSQVADTLVLVQRVLIAGGAILLLTITGISWYVARRSLQPVAEAAQTAEKVAAGKLEERMKVRGQDELARLSTSFNRMADSLAEQIVQLEALSQMQQRFVSDVSHELRTPLTTVRMAAEVLYLSRDEFSTVNARSTELLYDQVERFQGLLNDLLEISRFDAGAAQLAETKTDVEAVVSRAMATAQPWAEKAGSNVKVTIVGAEKGQRGVYASMDPRRIERIIRNLILNAVEHGEGNPIEVFIGEDSDAVAVAVRDHGIGLSEEDAVRVFERFWRKDPARARTTGGSGLGLSIARADAQLHGGALEAWGKPGVGSTFRLTLPKTLGAKIAESPLPLGPYGKEIGAVEAAVAAEAEESKSVEDKAVTAGAATVDKKDPASTEGSEAR